MTFSTSFIKFHKVDKVKLNTVLKGDQSFIGYLPLPPCWAQKVLLVEKDRNKGEYCRVCAVSCCVMKWGLRDAEVTQVRGCLWFHRHLIWNNSCAAQKYIFYCLRNRQAGNVHWRYTNWNDHEFCTEGKKIKFIF